MLSLPIHRIEISILPKSLLLFSRLPSTLLPRAGHNCRPWPRVLYQNCQEMPWPCDKPYVSTCSSPLALTHPPPIMRACSQDSRQLWMRNNGLVFSGTYLRWRRAANPTQPGLSAQQPKVRFRHSPPPPPDFILYSKGCIISLTSAGCTSASHFPVPLQGEVQGSLPLPGSFRIPGYQSRVL